MATSSALRAVFVANDLVTLSRLPCYGQLTNGKRSVENEAVLMTAAKWAVHEVMIKVFVCSCQNNAENLSNMDTIGAEKSVQISEVS